MVGGLCLLVLVFTATFYTFKNDISQQSKLAACCSPSLFSAVQSPSIHQGSSFSDYSRNVEKDNHSPIWESPLHIDICFTMKKEAHMYLWHFVFGFPRVHAKSQK